MEEIRFVGDLQRVQPQPGDVFVLTCDQNLSCHQAELLREAFARAMPTATLLILDAGMKLGVIGQPPEVRTTMNVRIEQPAAIDSAGGGFSVGGIDIGAGDDSAIGWFANGVVSPGIDEDWREKCKPKFGNALDFKMPPVLPGIGAGGTGVQLVSDYPTLEDCKAKFDLYKKFEPSQPGQPDRKITRPDAEALNLLRVTELPR
jgi:hypothetical protein